jgi:hypothetical protein
LLARISRDYFKQLTIEELEKKIKLDPLINTYGLFVERIKVLKQWIKRDGWDYGLRIAVRLMEKEKRNIAKKIIEALQDNIIYREACKAFGVADSVGLAILIAKLPLHLPLNDLKGLLGLTPNKTKGKYNRKLRYYLGNFAANLYTNIRKNHVTTNIPKLTEIVNHLPRGRAILKLQLMILKTLRIIYLTTVKPLASG